jgi:hypothetical protein
MRILLMAAVVVSLTALTGPVLAQQKNKAAVKADGKVATAEEVDAKTRWPIARKDRRRSMPLSGSAPSCLPMTVLDHKDQGALKQACFILGQIGSSKSVPALERTAGNKNKEVAAAATSAIAAIKDREIGASK